MWKLFRLGVKNFSGPSHGQIRIVSTTALTSDAESLDEESDVFGNLANNAKIYTLSKDYHSSHKDSNLPFFEAKKDSEDDKNAEFHNVEKLLKEIKWKDYLVVDKIPDKINDLSSTTTTQNSTSQKSTKENLKNDFTSTDHVRIKNDSSKSHLVRDVFDIDLISDENAGDEIYGKKLSPKEYAKRMLQLCKERKLKDALDILEKEMALQKIKPDPYCYNILINACGKAGYTLKAFELYRGMKARAIEVESVVYTGLFNACANSPDKKNGLVRATKLRRKLKDHNVLLNSINYHAMIKAFGHCGDMATAFEIADELIEAGHSVKTRTINFLLQACISNKESGFRHAIMVWRKMRSLNLKPCIYSYTLLMRCVRDCKAGELTLFSELLERPKRRKDDPAFVRNQNKESNTRQKYLSSGDIDEWLATVKENVTSKNSSNQEKGNETASIGVVDSVSIEVVNIDKRKKYESMLPNVLSRYYVAGKVEGISSLETPCERFALLGGSQGVLYNMRFDKIMPRIETFTLMLQSLPNITEAEEALISTMESSGVKLDVIFVNMLIKKRNHSSRFYEARDVLDLMQKYRISPDLVTFRCLADGGCFTIRMAVGLIGDMMKAGFRPDEPIMKNLICSSIIRRDYLYTLEMLKIMKQHHVIPSEEILTLLENLRKDLRKIQLERERKYFGKPIPKSEMANVDEINLFLLEYKKFLKTSKVELTEHPWAQYGFQPYEKRIVSS